MPWTKRHEKTTSFQEFFPRVVQKKLNAASSCLAWTQSIPAYEAELIPDQLSGPDDSWCTTDQKCILAFNQSVLYNQFFDAQ